MYVQKTTSCVLSFFRGTKVGLPLGEEQQHQSSSLQRMYKGRTGTQAPY